MTINEVYEKAGIFSLPISPEEAAKRLGIKLVSYKTMTEIYEISARELYEKNRFGFSFCEEGHFVIAINENSCCERRRRFTIAHEIAHCVLGHFSRLENVYENERAADRFAADFLAPICVLRKCGDLQTGEISRLCGISEKAAEICRKRIESAEKSPEDEAIIARFSTFISRYKARF